MRFGRSDVRIGLGVLLIFGASLFVYWPALRGEFIWDDWLNIVRNPLMSSPTGLRDIWLGREGVYDYYPLTWTTWWLEWRTWRRETLGYHVLNLVLHAGTAALLWRVLVRLTLPGALFAALAFALHPVNVESVAWITERKNTLSMFLLAASVALYLDADEGRDRARRGMYWWAVALFALSLLAKPSVVMLPAVLLLIAWWRRGRVARADVLAAAPFAVLSAVVAGVTILVHHSRGISALEVRSDGPLGRLATAGWCVWFYLYKLAAPLRLSFVYPRWNVRVGSPLHWVPLVALLLVFAILWGMRRRIGRGALAAIACFVLMLLPVLGFVDVFMFRYAFVADHWQYPAAIAILAGAFALIGRAGKTVTTAAGIIVCSSLGFAAWRHAHVYQTEEAIWTDAYEKNPNGALPMNQYASAHLWPSGHRAEARELWRRAISVEPRWRELYVSMGWSYLSENNPREAIRWFRAGARVPGGGKDPRIYLADTLVAVGEEQEAATWYEQALAEDPKNATYRGQLAILHEHAGNTDRALALYRDAAQVDLDDVNGWYVYGEALLRHGKPDEAQAALAEARRACGSDHAMLNSIGSRLVVAGYPEVALDAFAEVVRMKPDYAPAYNHMGHALEMLGRKSEAIAEYEQAVKANPLFLEAKMNIERLRAPSTSTRPGPH
jgi:tetratricopeptide (TPR) repeat protein